MQEVRASRWVTVRVVLLYDEAYYTSTIAHVIATYHVRIMIIPARSFNKSRKPIMSLPSICRDYPNFVTS